MRVPAPNSISRRLIGWLLVGGVMTSIVGVLITAVMAQRAGERALRMDATRSADRLAQMVAVSLWELDLDHAKQIGEAFATDRRVVSLTILDPTSHAARSIRRLPTTDTILVRSTVMHDGRAVGQVELAFDRGVATAGTRSIVRNSALVALLLLVMTILAVRFLLRRLLEQPMRELTATVRNAAAGAQVPRQPLVGYGELREFSAVLGEMSDRIVAQLTELQTANARLASEVAARRETEDELRLLGAALAAAANAIVITDDDGIIVWTNAAFTRFSGYQREEALGRTPGELLKSGRHDERFYRHLWRTITSGEVWSGELVNRRKDGSDVVEEMTITPLRDDAGVISHFIAVKQDISERRLLEEQMRQAQKMESVGLLAGGVAHDFNNQLGVIMGHAELALGEAGEASRLRESLQEIFHAATHSAELTRQLLTFARKQEIVPRVLDVNECVAHSLKMLQRLIGEQIQMSWQPGADLWPVLMDASQLDQILANLCVNARDAIDGVGRVTLSTRNVSVEPEFAMRHADASTGDYVRLAVVDTGCGMSPVVMERIFEPFFTTKAVGEGTGLGLSTVYGAVRQSHGFLVVESIEGTGTTFEIYLPRHLGAGDDEAIERATVATHRGRETILLVEDEPGILRMTRKALTALGYTVLAAATVEEAFAISAEHPGDIDLLLTDIVMPEMSGVDLAERLASTRQGLKVLFMSGFARGATGVGALQSAGRSFLAKPFAVTVLSAKVREVLDED